MVRLLKRAWIPLLIVVVVAIGGFAVYRLHGVFGKTELTRPGSGLAQDKPFNPKQVTWIFRPGGHGGHRQLSGSRCAAPDRP